MKGRCDASVLVASRLFALASRIPAGCGVLARAAQVRIGGPGRVRIATLTRRLRGAVSRLRVGTVFFAARGHKGLHRRLLPVSCATGVMAARSSMKDQESRSRSASRGTTSLHGSSTACRSRRHKKAHAPGSMGFGEQGPGGCGISPGRYRHLGRRRSWCRSRRPRSRGAGSGSHGHGRDASSRDRGSWSGACEPLRRWPPG